MKHLVKPLVGLLLGWGIMAAIGATLEPESTLACTAYAVTCIVVLVSFMGAGMYLEVRSDKRIHSGSFAQDVTVVSPLGSRTVTFEDWRKSQLHYEALAARAEADGMPSSAALWRQIADLKEM